MLLGYIFNLCEIHLIIASKGQPDASIEDFLPDSSGEVEDFAQKHNLRFEMLNFEECILAINQSFKVDEFRPDIIDVKNFMENQKYLLNELEKPQDAIEHLNQVLINAKIPFEDLVLVTQPEWDRYGNPITFGS